MGCDIHAFVEYESDFYAGQSWRSFSSNQIRLSRNYAMFGAMTAGEVRFKGLDAEYLVEPRGYPDDASLDTNDNYHLYVCDRDTGDDERVTNFENAVKWAKWGSEIKVFRDGSWVSIPAPEDLDQIKLEYENSSLMKITDPDAHTPSWLSTSEYVYAVEAADSVLNGIQSTWDVPYLATIDLMKSLEENTGGEARIVFWFDN